MSIVYLPWQTRLSYRRERPLVFTTGKTLHERFTPQDTPCVFIVKCGYIPRSAFSGATRSLVFSNRRCIDVNERFTSYRRGKFETMANSRIENRRRLEHELRLMEKKRRSVELPTTSTKKTSDKISDNAKHEKNFAVSVLNKMSPNNSNYGTPVSPNSNYIDKFSKINLSSADYCGSHSSESSFFNSPRKSKFYDEVRCFTGPFSNESAENSHWNTPLRSRRCDRFGCFVKNKDHDFNAVNGSYDAIGYYSVRGRSVLSRCVPDNQNTEIVCTANYSQSLKFPERYEYFKNRRVQKAATSPYHYYAPRESCRLKRQQVTKEQLDDEIDRYMSEIKFKPSATDDVEPFVEEYLLETEKYLNQQDSMDTLD